MKTTKTIWMISRQALLTSLTTMIISLPAGVAVPVAAAPVAPAATSASAVPRSVSFNGQRTTFAAGSVPAAAPVKAARPVAKATTRTMIADAMVAQSVRDTPLITLPSNGPAMLPVSDTSTTAPVMPAAAPPPPSPTITDKGSSVNLDFVDASIVDVLKALAIQSGSNIVTSPDVVGKVTVTLAHVSLESALDYVTKTSGYQWLRTGNTYIVGTDKSLQPFMPQRLMSTDRITRTVQFENSDPDDLMASIKAAIPDTVITLIKPGIDTTTVSSDGGKFTTTSGRQKGGVLMVTGLVDNVKRVGEFVALAEGTFHPSVEQSETSTYRIKYAFGPNLITVLHNLVPKLIVISGPGQQFDSGPAVNFSGSGAGAGNTLVDRYTVASAMPQGAVGDGYKDKADAKLTAPTLLVLNGTRDDVTRALDLLSKIDVKPVQLLFEAKVTEINDTDQKQLGVNWDFSKFNTSFGEFTPLDATGKPIPGDTDFPGQVLKVGTISRSRIPTMASMTIDALINNGRAKLLARPNVAALDGQKATMFVGDTVNYVSSISQTATGQNVTTASVNVGVILSLTGRASDDGYITLYLHPEVSQITQFLQVPGGGSLPQLSSRFADTVIRVKDGDTIAIGGLIQDNVNNSVNKVPILGDLPILGNFFKDVNKKKTRSEVVFFIKTSLIADHA